MGADNCVQCHPKSQIEKDLVVGDIRVNHKGLREAGYQCLTCHANISHPGTRPAVARASQNKMSICARCHDGVKLPDDCELCHINDVPASAPKVTMAVQLRGAECAGCHHSGNTCSSCHNGLTMPHPAGWQGSHGAVVNTRGKSICVGCHLKKDPRFCISCHGVVIPHPSGWRSGHASVGLDKPQVCVKCHGQDSCLRCHGLTMPHPAGWTSSHPSTALSSPSLCSRCHSSSFCTACHGVSLPHSGSFIADHPQYTVNNGGVCVKCHGNNGAGPSGCYGGECHSGSIG